MKNDLSKVKSVVNLIGNRSLEGLVKKKKVLVIPATEPTKVVSQSEQILVVPVANLEDVRKNITETVNAKTDVDGLISTDVQFFTENGENGYINSESKDLSSYASQHDDLYEASTETFKSTRKPFLIDNISQEIPYFMPNPSQEIMPSEHPPLTISVPIIAFLEPAKISDDKVDVPIAAILPMQDEISKLKNSHDEVQQNVQNYDDESSWSVDPNNWRLDLSSSEMGMSPSLYESSTKQIKYTNDINSKNSLPAKMSRVDITPLFWTSDADINYPKDPHDMEVAANIVFRPFFKYRQEMQQRSYRNPTYRRYNSYNSYPRRNYRYRP
ncbi:PREDICTED: uncharacterized protein LOC105143663 [Acromyrmex echinatior]|uniref:uncharacterized protein LOC105143663 n=1 Tax=Acromyrmex echinatior TaxID=103372 RepID=UPI000580E9BB|nr:PREDICTED: uncharacterized protein LOC105143663 [Acromyrmex echinatior]